MRILHLKSVNLWQHCNCIRNQFKRYATQSCTNFTQTDLTTKLKHDIENHWRDKLKIVNFDTTQPDNKYLVVPMFPYPSGYLHMGHVRVYSISDAMARFHRLNGRNVLHPIGWDAFGLPAENAAIERNILPADWTKHNIEHMRTQLKKLGCSFDWSRELSTCDPNYYKFTQWIFLQMFKEKLAFQREAFVNWDPVDKTVLANEQVDENGCSWRSGAKVEKKLLKQWFVRSTKFAKELYEGLDDPMLEDWNEIKKIQKNWIGPPNGYSFDLDLFYINTVEAENKLKFLTIWTDKPEYMTNPGFIAIKPDHILNESGKNNHLLDVTVKNPFNEGTVIPIIATDELEFLPFCDTYLGMPTINEKDKEIAETIWLKCDETIPLEKQREGIIKKAKNKNIGGYLVSPRIKDWLISRQRYWGTPIPIVHCSKCGTIPVPESSLPVTLPDVTVDEFGKPIPLNKRIDWLQTDCPKCKKSHAIRESDTMDTFVDSSWYFLRYLQDPNKNDVIFDKKLAKKVMPVDLYIGGMEHAVLHLYIARFAMQFMYKLGLVPTSEPFKRLLVQGMVNGRTYLTKDGRYISENDVNILNEKQNRAEETSTGIPVQMRWEKMSKSKKNGVDPFELFSEYSVDTVRLFMMGDVSPKSTRNWSKLTFPGILNWQHRLWLCLTEFHKIRNDDQIERVSAETDEKYKNDEFRVYEARNLHVQRAIYNFMYAHNFSSAIKNMQGLTDDLRKAPKNVIKFSAQYERALGHLFIMLAPIAPHFASELWSKFLSVPHRVVTEETDLKWSKDVLEQNWPDVDADSLLSLTIKVNGVPSIHKFPRSYLDNITKEIAMKKAHETDTIKTRLETSEIIRTKFEHYKGQNARLHITTNEKNKKSKNKTNECDDEQIEKIN